MGHVQDIHHLAVCDLCGKKQEIEKKELTSDIYGRIVPPTRLGEKVGFQRSSLYVP